MTPLIELINITKKFPNIVANDNVSLTLLPGEIHAVLGENGAGKSTLMSILFGLYQPDQGEIKKNGQLVKIHNPNDANKFGIGMVHQHFKLVDVFTVLDNIILGKEPHNHGIIDRKKAKKELYQLSESYGLKIDLDAKIEQISVGMQQRVEILKMLYRHNDILIFDEPTAVLTPQETEELLNIMRALIKEGKSILFITHKLQEVMAVTDRVTILRKGKYVGTVQTKETSVEALSMMMVGRSLNQPIPKEDSLTHQIVLDVRDISAYGMDKKKLALKNISFTVKQGEIVGIAGIEGNGQSELAFVLGGFLPPSTGSILYKNQPIKNLTIRQRNDLPIAHIPEDRHKYGLILDYPLLYNLSLKTYHQTPFSHFGFINFSHLKQHAEKLIKKFDIRSSQQSATATRSMSGGNQQKAIIARELDLNPDLLIGVQLTRGLDVGAIEFIHEKIVEERNKGKAILLISLELEEILKLSDRILVMYEGEIVANLIPSQTTSEEIGLYMAGGRRNQ
jgi:ABC-type uncharacterized transport system ATPase subunit